MKTNYVQVIILLICLVSLALGKAKPDTGVRGDVKGNETHTGGVKVLGRPGQNFLNAALAAMAPMIGRIVRMAPYVGTASNAVTGTINNGIVSGFAVPITDEFLDYHERRLQMRNQPVKDQTDSKRQKRSFSGKSRNLL